MLCFVVQHRVVEERLGWDAANVQARASELAALFNACHLRKNVTMSSDVLRSHMHTKGGAVGGAVERASASLKWSPGCVVGTVGHAAFRVLGRYTTACLHMCMINTGRVYLHAELRRLDGRDISART